MFLGNKDLKVEHHFTEAAGLKWHWVEAGSGEPVVRLFSLHFAFIKVSSDATHQNPQTGLAEWPIFYFVILSFLYY